jgi:pimeloyl-ACP methyl ester carboxylesterase
MRYSYSVRCPSSSRLGSWDMRGQPLAMAERGELVMPAVTHQDRNRDGSQLESPRACRGSSPAGSPGLVDWTTRMIVDTPLRVLLKTLLLNTNVNMTEELQKIQVPALVLHGDQDASAPIELTGRKTAALLGNAALHVYPGAGHGLYASDHEAVNADILAFIGNAKTH